MQDKILDYLSDGQERSLKEIREAIGWEASNSSFGILIKTMEILDLVTVTLGTKNMVKRKISFKYIEQYIENLRQGKVIKGWTDESRPLSKDRLIYYISAGLALGFLIETAKKLEGREFKDVWDTQGLIEVLETLKS